VRVPPTVDRGPGKDVAGKISPPRADGSANIVAKPGALQRKIVYTGTVDLVVENFDRIPEQVDALARQFDGYLARTNISGSPGSQRRGLWSIRVPVAHFEKFLAAVQRLGEVRDVGSNSQDMTAEYYDVEARIRNAKKEEERLLKLLADATGKLDEILQVERELARIRGEVEQMEGRLRMLDNLTALSTVDLRVDEIKNYRPIDSPRYATRLHRALNASMDALADTLQALSIIVVMVAPWLAVFGVPLVLLAIALRLARRRRSAAK
jgi:hypothetical protein